METSVDLRSIFIANKLNQFEYFIETNKIHSELRASVPTRSEVSPFNASSFPVLHILEYIRLWQRRRSTSRVFFLPKLVRQHRHEAVEASRASFQHLSKQFN